MTHHFVFSCYAVHSLKLEVQLSQKFRKECEDKKGKKKKKKKTVSGCASWWSIPEVPVPKDEP